METPEFERLVALYARRLELEDRADAEGYAGDNAWAVGRFVTAEQHYTYSRGYRQRAEETARDAAHLLQELAGAHSSAYLSRLRGRAEASAREQRYGSADVSARPYFE